MSRGLGDVYKRQATIPTMIPAMRSDMNVFLLYVFKQENKLDLIANAFI